MESYNMNLLASNYKLSKDNGGTYLVTGLSMAPHSIGGNNVCEQSTPGCKSTCVLWFTGRTVTEPVRNAMLKRKEWFFTDRLGFEAKLMDELSRHERRAEKIDTIPAARLNVASDLDWTHIYKEFPGIRFYSYTKVKSRLSLRLPNYDVTYSYSEKASHDFCKSLLKDGGNVAVVFSTHYNGQRKIYGKLPDSWSFAGKEFPVVDGDVHDVRLKELDGQGVIVGLRFKGSLARKEQAIRKGFCLVAS